MREEDSNSLEEGGVIKCIRFSQEGKDKVYFFLDIEGKNVIKIAAQDITATVKPGDVFAVLEIKEDGRPVLKKLFAGGLEGAKKAYKKKELAITIYAFAENEVNTSAYKRLDTIEEAVEFFKQLLNKPEISIINVRKMKLKTVGEKEA